MTERDRKYIEEVGKQLGQMPEVFGASVVIELLVIIDRLDKQLTELKKEGKPVEIFAAHIEPTRRDDSIIDSTRLQSDRQCAGELGVVSLRVGNIRRLAKALKEVKG